MPKFYEITRIRAQNGSPAGRVNIYGEISSSEFWGNEITPSKFVADLAALGNVSEIEVHIFSGGGDLFAGLAIYNILKQRAEPVIVYIDGLAASAATVISCAGDTVYIPETAMMMVHKPYIDAWLVNSKEAEDVAKELKKTEEPLISVYMEKTGKTRDEVIALMDGENGKGTWLSAAEAITFGLADAYTPENKLPLEVAAQIKPGVYNYRGHKIDITMFEKAAERTAGIINTKVGGNKMRFWNKKSKTKHAATPERTPKAEIVFTEMVCPSCNGSVNMNPNTGEVLPGSAVDQGTQSVTNGSGTEGTFARFMPSNVQAQLYDVTCPHCGNHFAWDTDANVDGDEGSGVEPAMPLGTGTNGAPTPGNGAASGQPAPASSPAAAPAARTRTKPVARVPVKPKAELAQSLCPSCGAAFMFDTAQTEIGADAAGTEGYLLTCSECAAEYIEPMAAPEPTAIPVGTTAQAAYRMGVMAERERIIALEEMALAAPGTENMIAAAIKSGASVAAMSRNVFKALAKNPNIKSAQYVQAINRDVEASGVNQLRFPQHHGSKASFTDSVFEKLNNR